MLLMQPDKENYLFTLPINYRARKRCHILSPHILQQQQQRHRLQRKYIEKIKAHVSHFTKSYYDLFPSQKIYNKIT